MIMQKETEKKYRAYNVGCEARNRAGKGKAVKVIARSDNPASVQLNVTQWLMLYSCPIVPKLASRVTERKREACCRHKIKKSGMKSDF
jgi:hypothetical protein